ncbi:YbdK family carboxylate-amine ligase [Streptomyces kaniharaensis]|uniref:Putative glutamate--cysteine ligase 2 n=1 Tax=Streptomyces kaniharaensis TaxID=212423 RepID=A0A6N7L4Q4_9ACTN|nr:glutamate--cysteine ligase [Streptomyces kaniharaensis]MQS16863.1 YbdK family carboxylate-amine ligase [Streptomyces kaniharaensis]
MCRPSAPPIVPTLGVEEEFLLVDRQDRLPAERAPQVIADAAAVLGDQVQAEFFPVQVEVCSHPAARLDELRADLARLRSVVAAAAADAGCLLVASGTPVLSGPGPGRITDDPRYRRMAARYAGVLDGYDGALCGCHVHLGAEGRGLALALGNHLRPWLPVVQALAVNSPFTAGRDSGFASWRTVQWSRWPTVGPAPVLDEEQYEALADALVECGVLLDRRMIYWYARPSEHVPTLEVRIADVNADLETVVLLAALLRGLAAVLLGEIRAGRSAPALPSGLVGAAHWQAARTGLSGVGVDPLTGRRAPMAELADRLVERAAPGLAAAGDLAAVESGLARLHRLGTGATRQRRAYRRHGRLTAVVDELAAVTAAVP